MTKISPPLTRCMPVASRSALNVLPPPLGPLNPIINGTLPRVAGLSSNVRCWLPIVVNPFQCSAFQRPRGRLYAHQSIGLVARPLARVHTLGPRVHRLLPTRAAEREHAACRLRARQRG